MLDYGDLTLEERAIFRTSTSLQTVYKPFNQQSQKCYCYIAIFIYNTHIPFEIKIN